MADERHSEDNKRPSAAEPTSIRLPFPAWWPALAGAIVGVTFRLVFSGQPGEMYAAMMGAFIYLTPVIVGAVTVFVAEAKTRRSWSYYLVVPMTANVLFVAGTLLILIEGLVCAVVIAPLFMLLGAIGGLLTGALCRLTMRAGNMLLCLGALPLLLGSAEHRLPVPERVGQIERTIWIDAPAEVVWRNIMHATDIRPEEVGRAWVYRIGVPVPQTGISEQTTEGLVRRVTMAKDIYFDQVITDWRENEHVRWRYRFHPDSFPPHTLDEHVVIGGHYFDLIDTAYTLTPAHGGTALNVRMTYRVSTQFNWYADPVARILLGNVGEVNLEYYRQRSQRR